MTRATDKPAAPGNTARMTYRGADGRPHIVAEQEQSAREAQQGSEEPAQPGAPALATRNPD